MPPSNCSRLVWTTDFGATTGAGTLESTIEVSAGVAPEATPILRLKDPKGEDVKVDAPLGSKPDLALAR